MGWIVHINGYPGVGKLTVARALAEMTGARLLDNHCLLNPSNALFEREQPEHGRLRQAVRDVVFDAMAAAPGTNVVMTDAFSDEPMHKNFFVEIERLAVQRGDRLCPVILEVSEAEHRVRVAMPERKTHRKLVDPDFVISLRSKHELLRPAGATVVKGTGRGAAEVAAEIIQLHELEAS